LAYDSFGNGKDDNEAAQISSSIVH